MPINKEEKTAPSAKMFSPEVIKETFATAEKLARAANQKTDRTFSLTADPKTGFIESKGFSELMTAQDALILTEAKPGDVVWWIDEASSQGYFFIETPYKIENNGQNMEYGDGVIQIKSKDGKPVVETPPGKNSWIIGASFSPGSLTKLFCISKNIPVEFAIQADEGQFPEVYTTGNIVNMGIIPSKHVA